MKSLYHVQGPVRFEDGIREATELRVLQYRTDYINGTLISEVNNSVLFDATMEQELRLVDIAYVIGSRDGLEFPNNYSRNDIWPSKS